MRVCAWFSEDIPIFSKIIVFLFIEVAHRHCSRLLILREKIRSQKENKSSCNSQLETKSSLDSLRRYISISHRSNDNLETCCKEHSIDKYNCLSIGKSKRNICTEKFFFLVGKEKKWDRKKSNQYTITYTSRIKGKCPMLYVFSSCRWSKYYPWEKKWNKKESIAKNNSLSSKPKSMRTKWEAWEKSENLRF